MLLAQANINQTQERPSDSLTIQSATADKGYFAVEEMRRLQREGIRTVIFDPVPNRNFAKLAPLEAKAARHARRSSGSKSGKQLLKKRGMHLERSFAHLLPWWNFPVFETQAHFPWRRCTQQRMPTFKQQRRSMFIIPRLKNRCFWCQKHASGGQAWNRQLAKPNRNQQTQ